MDLPAAHSMPRKIAEALTCPLAGAELISPRPVPDSSWAAPPGSGR
jgi:hypothetical protein